MDQTSVSSSSGGANTTSGSGSPNRSGDGSGGRGEKWWQTANQKLQTSKLELSVNSSQLPETNQQTSSRLNENSRSSSTNHVKIPAGDYFSVRSDMPDICGTTSDVKIDETVLAAEPPSSLHRRQFSRLQQQEQQKQVDSTENQADRTLCEENEPKSMRTTTTLLDPKLAVIITFFLLKNFNYIWLERRKLPQRI